MQLSQETRTPERSHLAVTGEIDMSTAPELRDAGVSAISAGGCAELVIDLSGVTFMDSSALGALVAIRGTAVQLSRRMRISAASERARQVIEVCGLAAEFGLDARDSVPCGD